MEITPITNEENGWKEILQHMYSSKDM